MGAAGARRSGPAAVTVVTAALALAACAPRGLSLYRLVPPAGETAVSRTGDLTLRARYLDRKDTALYLSRTGREALVHALNSLPLAVFLLTVENGASGSAILDPAGVRFAGGIGPPEGLLSYAHIYTQLPRGPGRQRLLAQLQEVTLNRPLTVQAGGEVTRLLLFPRPEKVMDRTVLLVEGIHVAGRTVGAALSFNAQPPER